jgi:AraC family transcriptional regulator, transcriptional activator of pobA
LDKFIEPVSSIPVGLVARQIAVEAEPPEGKKSAKLFDRFEVLLEQHCLKHWTVSDYANIPAITPTHLSRLTWAAPGHPASHLILERIVREARRNLIYTSLPISTIAYALGFDDPRVFQSVIFRRNGHVSAQLPRQGPFRLRAD